MESARAGRAEPLIAGVADLVEFRAGSDGETAFPVESKRGKPKLHPMRCSFALKARVFEEMTGRPVPEGALYYGGSVLLKRVGGLFLPLRLLETR